MAVRELRARLKLSQAAFGLRINRTVNTVVKYETAAPRGEILVAYAALALDSGFLDLFVVFRTALVDDLGVDCLRVLAWKSDLVEGVTVPKESRVVVKAFLRFLGAPDLALAEELLRDGLTNLLLKNFSIDEKRRSGHAASPTEQADSDGVRVGAVRELRLRLGLTQTAFGLRINRTLGTVVRYESQVAPRGEALVPYATVALDSGFEDLLAIFRSGLIRDLGPDCERVLGWVPGADTIAVPPELRSVVSAFVKFLNARDLQPAEEVVKNGVISLLLRNFVSVGEKTRKQS